MNILLMIIIILVAGGISYILYKKNKLDKTVEYLVKLLEIYGKHVLNKVKLVLLINTLRTWVLANTENKVLKAEFWQNYNKSSSKYKLDIA
ncbi:hypothetical protein [Sebaldella termitidis]|uniref:hypothetical protein n=1 Tax=Sebaldella termitidis TaxID=826 RepID=UPI003EBD71D0